MQFAILPDNEEQRLKNLLSYEILDTPEEKDFNDLATLAVHISGCPFALISFTDKDRQWFKAKKNITEKESGRNISFCSHAMLKNEVMVVNDMHKDERFFDNPLVTGNLAVSFYAGVPIISEAGFAVGTVCVIDTKAKHIFSVQQQHALEIIAGQVSKLLELRLKNKLIIDRSKLLIEAEKQFAQLTLTNYDKEKSHIANELQENFAQTLAAIKLYIEFAEESKEMSGHFLKKSKGHITELIREVRDLTKTLVPTTMDNDNYIDIIQDMAIQFGKDNNINIQFFYTKNFGSFDTNTGLSIFRIIENQIQIALNSGAKNITIKIKKTKTLSVVFTDDCVTDSLEFREKDILFNNTITRIGILKGKLQIGKDTAGKNFIALTIPISAGK